MRIGSLSLLLSWHWQECPFFPCPKTTIFKSHRVSSHSSEETRRLSSCQRTPRSVDGKQIKATSWRKKLLEETSQFVEIPESILFYQMHLTLQMSIFHAPPHPVLFVLPWQFEEDLFWHISEQRTSMEWSNQLIPWYHLHGNLEASTCLQKSC